MKPEVRQTIAEQEALTGKLACLPVREGNADVLILSAVDLTLLDALEVIDGFGDAVLQLGNGCFVVGKLQKLLTGETPRRVCGVIGRRSHLTRQIKHVGRQPHVQ